MTWLREALIAVTVVYCKAQSEFEDGEEPIKVKPAKGVGLNLNVLGSSFAADGMPDFDAWFTVKCFMTIVALFYGYSLFKVLFRGEAPYPGAAKDQKYKRHFINDYCESYDHFFQNVKYVFFVSSCFTVYIFLQCNSLVQY